MIHTYCYGCAMERCRGWRNRRIRCCHPEDPGKDEKPTETWRCLFWTAMDAVRSLLGVRFAEVQDVDVDVDVDAGDARFPW